VNTATGLLAIGILALALEVWTFLNKKPHDTISETVWKSFRLPLIPLLVGILLGHFFFPPRSTYTIIERAQAAGCPDHYEINVACKE
jgi:hypothetical protein